MKAAVGGSKQSEIHNSLQQCEINEQVGPVSQ